MSKRAKKFSPGEEVWVRAVFSHVSSMDRNWVYATPANYGGTGPIGFNIKNVVRMPHTAPPEPLGPKWKTTKKKARKK